MSYNKLQVVHILLTHHVHRILPWHPTTSSRTTRILAISSRTRALSARSSAFSTCTKVYSACSSSICNRRLITSSVLVRFKRSSNRVSTAVATRFTAVATRFRACTYVPFNEPDLVATVETISFETTNIPRGSGTTPQHSPALPRLPGTWQVAGSTSEDSEGAGAAGALGSAWFRVTNRPALSWTNSGDSRPLDAQPLAKLRVERSESALGVHERDTLPFAARAAAAFLLAIVAPPQNTKGSVPPIAQRHGGILLPPTERYPPGVISVYNCPCSLVFPLLFNQGRGPLGSSDALRTGLPPAIHAFARHRSLGLGYFYRGLRPRDPVPCGSGHRPTTQWRLRVGWSPTECPGQLGRPPRDARNEQPRNHASEPGRSPVAEAGDITTSGQQLQEM
uniref:Uncharacterized protein n=1 Tax=Bombyx mori TaxID=7091 RepID=A0A8R2M452_BOMMO|nr:uncharacterized protein LOC119630058 [Bombyx mori]